MSENEIYVCPTCKSWKYLEIYGSSEKDVQCYCRKCEEGCVKPSVISVDEQGNPLPGQKDRP